MIRRLCALTCAVLIQTALHSTPAMASPAPVVCTTDAATLPLTVRTPPYFNVKRMGNHFKLEDSKATICIGDDRVTITADKTHTIVCTDIIGAPGNGMGYSFKDGDTEYDLWFLIKLDREPMTLEFGLWNADAENAHYFWADTAAEICNI